MQPPTTSDQALQQAEQYQSTIQTPQQALDAANTQYGTSGAQQQVSGLRQAINNTTTLLNNVAPGVMGRTGQSLETSAQANREIQNEQAPISTELDKQNQDYTTANANYADLEQKAESLASSNESAQQNQLGYLMNIYSALYGKEQTSAQAAAQQSQFQQSLAEQSREANLTAANAANSGAVSPSLNSLLGGDSSSSGTDPQQQQAANALVSLFKTNNVGTVASTINAIKKSASFGNAYDKTKLTLLNQYLTNSPYGALIKKALGAGGTL